MTVYRCLDGEYKNTDKIEFFALDKEYAQNFGHICYKFQIDTNRAKILDLEKWNKIYKNKTDENGNLFNRVQGIFVIGKMAIESNYENELAKFSQTFDENIIQKFLDEFNSCDAIYGQDAGLPGQYTFAVKNKDILIPIPFLQ